MWIWSCEEASEDVEELEEVDVILQDPMDEWREHTEGRIVFLNQIDMQ